MLYYKSYFGLGPIRGNVMGMVGGGWVGAPLSFLFHQRFYQGFLAFVLLVFMNVSTGAVGQTIS